MAAATIAEPTIMDSTPIEPTPLPAPPAGDRILPGSHVMIVLPSGVQKILRVSPDTTISLGKHGSFPSNLLIHRPYNSTFDIETSSDGTVTLRRLTAAEILEPIVSLGTSATPEDGASTPAEVLPAPAEAYYDLPGSAMRTNQLIIDTTASQTLSTSDIEALKASTTSSGRDIVTRLVAGHTAIDQKTPFSLQKYTARKIGKFLRRFEVRRVNVASLVDFLPEQKEPARYLEFRQEQMGLCMSLADIKFGGRYLVVDETGGLVVAAVAERLGLLDNPPLVGLPAEGEAVEKNTIHLVHANEQPNLSALTFFNYDANTPPPSHPLTHHLKTLTWLQMLSPDTDTTLDPPKPLEEGEGVVVKPGKRATYMRKFARWKRQMAIVEGAREGGFDALIVAAHMAVPGVLKALVGKVRPGGQVVVYCPNLEQAVEVADLYSSSRRAAAVAAKADVLEARQKAAVEAAVQAGDEEEVEEKNEEENWDDERPDPTLLLAPTVHRVQARKYQVLPGRTHPVMTMRGGGEGVVVHGVRVEPVVGRVDARGAFGGKKRSKKEEGEGEGKRRKVEEGETEA